MELIPLLSILHFDYMPHLLCGAPSYLGSSLPRDSICIQTLILVLSQRFPVMCDNPSSYLPPWPYIKDASLQRVREKEHGGSVGPEYRINISGTVCEKSSLKTEAFLMRHQDQPKHIRTHLSLFIYLLTQYWTLSMTPELVIVKTHIQY